MKVENNSADYKMVIKEVEQKWWRTTKENGSSNLGA